jgi:hypothetical protein
MAHPLPPVQWALPALRDYPSAVGEGIWSGYGEAALEPDRLFLVVVGAAAASVAISPDFDPVRGLRLPVGFASDLPSASAGAGAAIGDAAGAISAVDLRPRPSSFANIERRSE